MRAVPACLERRIMADSTNEGGFWALVAALATSLIVNVFSLAKQIIDGRNNKTMTDAQRVDAAHAAQVTTLMSRVNDNERRFDLFLEEHKKLISQHANCEKAQSEMAGRICLLEEQSEECIKDRQRLHAELTALKSKV